MVDLLDMRKQAFARLPFMPATRYKYRRGGCRATGSRVGRYFFARFPLYVFLRTSVIFGWLVRDESENSGSGELMSGRYRGNCK